MKNIFLLAFLAIILSFGCRKGCPPDEKTGDLTLTEKSRSFDPYQGNEKLIFINQNGQELKLSAIEGRQRGTNKLCYKKICTELKYGSPSACAYYDSEFVRYGFTDDTQSVYFDILFSSDVYEEGAANFYDIMQISGSYNPGGLVAKTVIDARDGNANDVYNPEPLDEQDEINGFENVYFKESDFFSFYYNTTQGVVGFKHQDNEWWLDRVE